MKHQKSLPKTSKYFTPALVFGLNVQVSGVKMGCFHKVLPNVKSVYVTLQNFTPDLKKFYTDISAVSATLWNSAFVFVFLFVSIISQRAWKPIYINTFFFELLLSFSLTLSLYLSLSLYSSSPYDRRHRPLYSNISYEGSGMILGWFIRL